MTEGLAAPALMPAEVANVLRRSSATGESSSDVSALAHGDLLDPGVELFPHGPIGPRVWELRENLTVHDAWYVALAEAGTTRSDTVCCATGGLRLLAS